MPAPIRRSSPARCDLNVTADDLAAAVAMASQCPALDQGGGVEVGVITEIFRNKRLTAQGLIPR